MKTIKIFLCLVVTIGVALVSGPNKACADDIVGAVADENGLISLVPAEFKLINVLYIYNVTRSEFTFSFLMEDKGNGFADFFALTSTANGRPPGRGEAAVIYFNFQNTQNPIVSVVASSGGTAPWRDGDGATPGIQPPDVIANSVSSGILIAHKIEDRVIGAKSQRSVIFTIDATLINNHTPMYPVQNQGAKYENFDDIADSLLLGLWWDNYQGSSVSYNSGNIASLTSGKQMAYFDAQNHPLYATPNCEEKSPYMQNAKVGETVNVKALFTDRNNEKLSFEYVAPAGTMFSPEPLTPTQAPVTTMMSYEIQPSDAGNELYFAVTGTDSFPTSDRCSFKVFVDEIEAPECVLKGAPTIRTQCEGAVTTVAIDGSMSSDPANRPLSFQYNLSCPDDTEAFLTSNGATATVSLLAPGKGQSVKDCAVSLEVQNNLQKSSICGLNIEADPCVTECPGNQTKDICGVCGGDGTSCLDCKGVPFGTAVVDNCGVCDGDGTTCGCVSQRVDGLKADLDSAAGVLFQYGQKEIRRARRAGVSRKFLKGQRSLLEVLYNAAWTVIWTTWPDEILSCTQVPFCVNQDLSSSISAFMANVDTMAEAGLDIGKKRCRAQRKNGKIIKGCKKKVKRKINKKRDVAVGLSEIAPTSMSVCSTPTPA